MSRVPLQDPETATGRIREVFDRVASYYGMVPKLQQAMAPMPEITTTVAKFRVVSNCEFA